MDLFFRRVGQGTPLIILHGLYGSSDNWLTIARNLSEQYEVFIPDLRNHGHSPHHPQHTYPLLCADIIEMMDNNDIEQCVMLGYSMGGKVAMHVAMTVPQRIKKLIIDDIAPVNYCSSPDFSTYGAEHLNIVDTLLNTDLTQYSKREEINEAWKHSIRDENVRRFLLKNLQRGKEDNFNWRINIQAIAHNLPHILNGMNEPDRGWQIEVPTLFIKGEHSPYISSTMYPLIRQRFVNYRIANIPNAGHWVHVEQPAAFLDEIHQFLTTE